MKKKNKNDDHSFNFSFELFYLQKLQHLILYRNFQRELIKKSCKRREHKPKLLDMQYGRTLHKELDPYLKEIETFEFESNIFSMEQELSMLPRNNDYT